MRRACVIVNNELGLHARAAAQLVRQVSPFKSKVVLKRSDLGLEADAKSILSLLALSAGKGVELEVLIDGEDEIEALSAVQALFANGFGENGVQV